MRGGVDISPPVIRLLTRWDRAGGHDINDADYGKSVWDPVIIAGIWPIELLASGLGSLLILAIRAAKPPRDLSRNQGIHSEAYSASNSARARGSMIMPEPILFIV